MRIRVDIDRFFPLISGIYSLWLRTLRVEFIGPFDETVEMKDAGKPVIFGAWHNELFSFLGLIFKGATHEFVTIVSQSKDGELIARAIEKFGPKAVRGSSSRGGVKALLGLKRVIEKEKRIWLITMDGPRGPRHEIKDGILFLAHRMGAHVVPLRVVAMKKITVSSWDRFEIPLPFSKVKAYVGKPYKLPEGEFTGEYLERERARLKKRLDRLGPI